MCWVEHAWGTNAGGGGGGGFSPYILSKSERKTGLCMRGNDENSTGRTMVVHRSVHLAVSPPPKAAVMKARSGALCLSILSISPIAVLIDATAEPCDGGVHARSIISIFLGRRGFVGDVVLQDKANRVLTYFYKLKIPWLRRERFASRTHRYRPCQ